MKKNAIMRDLVDQLKKIFAQDLYFYSFLIFLVILIGQLPIVLHYFHCPKGYYYPLLDKITADDYYYLSLIRYGMGSAWLTKIPYVIAEHKSSLIQIFFILLGKLSLLTNIGPAEIFAIFRVIGGAVFVLSTVLLFKTVLSKSQTRLAFIFFLFAQPLVWLNDGLFTKAFGVWIWVWHYGEAARRISSIPPHYTLGRALAVLSLLLLFLFIKKRRLSSAFTGAILAFLAGIIYPPPVFIIFFSLSLAFVFYAFLKKLTLKNILTPKNLGIVFFILGFVLPLVVLKSELAKGHPWSGWSKIELGWNKPNQHFEWNYLRMLGVLVVLTPFSLPKVFARKDVSYFKLFLFLWFISPFILFPLSNILSVGKIRFTEGSQIVPLSVLAIWGIDYLFKKIKRLFSLQTAKIFIKSFLTVFIVYFSFITVHVGFNLTLNLWPPWRNIYLHPDELKTLSFLARNAEEDSIIVAGEHVSAFIPAFARVRTVIGFPGAYSRFADYSFEKEKIEGILTASLSESEVMDYLLKRKVNFVYYDTSIHGKKEFYPEILESVYKNKYFEIYKVKEIK